MEAEATDPLRRSELQRLLRGCQLRCSREPAAVVEAMLAATVSTVAAVMEKAVTAATVMGAAEVGAVGATAAGVAEVMAVRTAAVTEEAMAAGTAMEAMSRTRCCTRR